jgi:hypothetical protein
MVVSTVKSHFLTVFVILELGSTSSAMFVTNAFGEVKAGSTDHGGMGESMSKYASSQADNEDTLW